MSTDVALPLTIRCPLCRAEAGKHCVLRLPGQTGANVWQGEHQSRWLVADELRQKAVR